VASKQGHDEREVARTAGGAATGSPPDPTGGGSAVTEESRTSSRTSSGQAAGALAPLLELLLGDPLPVRFELWDGSGTGPTDGPGSVLVRSPDALRRILWGPGELGMARAYVVGDLELRGDLFGMLRALRHAAPRDLRRDLRTTAKTLRATYRLGAIGLPLPKPDLEASPHGRRHSKERDSEVVRHHYDISNEFYRLVLGPSMTYSCARFDKGAASLEEAQESKHDLICRKLGLHERPGCRLLDVGCGWGSMALHAARHYGAHVVGVTLSAAQAERGCQRAKEAGLEHQIDIRLLDYRDLRGERFDAISSIGMSEHVGKSETAGYFESLHDLLADSGRLLNHAISSVGGSRLGRHSFVGRYVFPDGELLDVGDVVLAMERAGFEVRDVESLREHYSRTLHAWVENLEAGWEEAVAEAGLARARVWRLYMAASAIGFDDGGLSVHQVLGVKPEAGGKSRMPPTRSEWS
jgi:cyclopropane-fatty-acyl-phospholipid synthase